MQRRDILLIHTADLHIGSDVYAEEAFEGFRRVLDLVRTMSADALLIAGDLFDRRDLAGGLVDHVFRCLEELERPVVVLPGNHDTVLTHGNPASLPSGSVHVLTAQAGETVHFPELTLSVWGRPVVDHSPAFRPLAKPAPRPDNGWYIVMAHGLFVDGSEWVDFSSPIHSDDLDNVECDYVALGHVHAFRRVPTASVPTYYSGAPSGTRFRTAAVVRLDSNDGVEVTQAFIAKGDSIGLDSH